MKQLFYLGALCLLLAGCAKDETVNPQDRDIQFRGPTVPFNATYQTKPKIVVPPPFIGLEIPGKGNGLHLGKSTWYSNSQVNVTVFPFQQTGDMTFTAADGSTLIGHFAGIGLPVADVATHKVTFEGDYWITGGTGRFTGATGSGTYSGWAELEGLAPGTVGVGQVAFVGVLHNP